ncbi:MAG: SRPBCC domain-containing protein [Bacteroidota bacterium]|nr:SRPBCC domain-containing protein [Bacteroidota bacterium]
MKKKLLHKSVTINATPKLVFQSFIDPNRLTAWLHAHSAVVALCIDGPYSIGWHAESDGDFYVCCGKIKSFELHKMLKITGINYFFARKKTIGPLDFTLTFEKKKSETNISFKLYGAGTGAPWEKNFKAVFNSWEESLYLLKKYIEKDTRKSKS